MSGAPPPPGLVWEDESPEPTSGPNPALGKPPAGLVWEDELQAAPAPSQPVAPPAGPPFPTGALPPAGLPPPAGGSALRPGSLAPQVIQPGNPLREAMLGRQREAGGAPLASLGPQAIQEAGAAAAPPMPETSGPGIGDALKVAGVSAAQGTPGLIAGAARFVPETAMRVRRGVTDQMADAIGATEVQREILHDATKKIMLGTPFFASEFQAEKLRKLDDAVMRPAEKFWEETPTAKRMAEKRSTQSTGEALLDPERWVGATAGALPSLVAMGLTGGGSTAMGVLPAFMEGGSKLREEEDRERRTGAKPKDLSVAAVAGITGIVNGALERWGFENAVGHLAEFLPKEARRGFLSVVAKGIQGAVGEGGTEVLQQVIPNVLTKALIDSSQDLGEGVLDSLMGGVGAGGAMGTVHQASHVGAVDARKARMDDRRAWRAEDGPSTPPAPLPFAEGGPGRGAVPQADLDAINEGVRNLEKPLSPSQKLERLKLESAALDARVRSLQSELGHPTNDPSMQAPPRIAPVAPAPLEEPLAPQPPHQPISVDQLLGAQALRDVVKATDFRDQTADARGRNVQNAVNAEYRQRIAETPGAALRLVLGDDPALAPAAPEPYIGEHDATNDDRGRSEVGGRGREEGLPDAGRGAGHAGRPGVDSLDGELDGGRGPRSLPGGAFVVGPEGVRDARTGRPVTVFRGAQRGAPTGPEATQTAHLAGEHWTPDKPYAEVFAGKRGSDGVVEEAALEVKNPWSVEDVSDYADLAKIDHAAAFRAGREHAAEGGDIQAIPNQLFHKALVDQEEATLKDKEPDPILRRSAATRRAKAQLEAAGFDSYHHRPQSPEGGKVDAFAVWKNAGAKRRGGGGQEGGGTPPPVSAPPSTMPAPAAPSTALPRAASPVVPAAPAAAASSTEASPAPPAAPAPAPNPEPTTEAFTRKGKTGEAFTADGERVGTQWAIADAFDELVPSHSENGVGDLEPNPAFAQVLQPRNRERVASQDQIGEMAKNIRPGALGESFNASDGAPIVGPDRLVESGNGRTLALRRAFRTGKGEAYRAWLEEHAADFGLTPEDVRAVKAPVLVRVRTTPTSDRAELVKKFNVATVATMSASETAAADADRLTPAMLAGFEPGGDGNAVLAARNRGFVEKFFSSVPANERGRLIDSEGQLSQDGVRRIQAALMAKAYGSSPVLERLAESTDDNIKSVSTALMNAAPGMAAVKAGIAKGDILPLDPTPGIIEAAEKLSHLRETKTTVADFLDQTGLFGDDMSPAGKEFLRTFEEYKRSGKKLSEVLTFLSESLITEGGAKQETLFDDSPAPRLEDFIRAARRTVSDRGQVSLFGGDGDLSSNGPENDRPGSRPAGGPAGPVDKPRVSLTQGLKSTPPTPRHVMLIERYARSMSASWKDAPKIVVVSTEAELPEAIRERAESFDATGGVDGVYMGAKDDRVFLVASRLNSREDVARVVLHEVMGHAGLRRILDRGTFNTVMDQIADSLPKDIEAKAREYGLDLKDKGQRREAADEVLAEWASRPEAPPRAITRAMVAIRGWLRQHFPNLKWTEADVRELLAKARTRIERGATGGKSESSPRFSRKAQEPAKTLVALHNTNADGIRAMGRLGGVPIPSIAVTKPGISFDSYGAVTLIGDRSLVDPKRDSRNRVFESDIWSPRQPLPSRKFDRKAFTRFGEKVNDLLGNPKEWAQRFDPNAMDPPRDEGGFDRLIETFDRSGYNSFHVQRAYLLSRGTDVPLVMREENGRREVNYGETREALDAAIEPHREDFRKWLAAELEPVFGPEHLAAGRKRLPYTLDNLVDVMRKMGLRGSEQSMFESLGKQKAKSSRELRSVEAMHRAEGKLTSEFDMEQAKEAMSLDFHAFADELGKNRLFSGPFARLDEASASLGDAMKRGLSPETLKRALLERGFPEPSPEALEAGVEVARSIQQAPTQYFEAKPQRGVRLTEFRGAVIPENSPADVRGILERAGLDVRTYKSGDADSRREAVESLSAERDLRFSRSSSSAEDRIYDAMVARARARATAAAETAKRVQAELEDPGDVMEARRDPNLPEHSNEIQNHIRPYGPRETIKGLLNPVEALYQQLIRRHFAVEQAGAAMGTDKGPAHRDPGVVAELAAGHSARAEQMIAGSGGFRNGADGNIEWTGNRSLESILGDLGPGRLNELRRYLVARRAIELHHRTPPQQELGATQERTIYSGITEAAAQQEVAGAPQDIKAAAEQVTALLDDALRYWADAGGLSPAAVDVIRDMNRAYVPFYRIFEGKEPQKQGRLVLPAKRGVALQSEQAVKTIFGSQRDILDPLVAVADHIQRMVRAADLNRVGKTLVEAAALNPEAAFGLVEEVTRAGSPTEGVTNEGKALQDAAVNFGVEVDDEAASALSFLSDKKLSYADDRIKVWQGGKLKEYRVAREIGESLRALGPEEATFFSKAVTFPASLLRAGVTKNPIFQLHNFLRDTADASVQTRNGFIPILDSIRGFKEALRDGSLRREWLAAGGGFARISGGGLKGAEKTIREIAPRTRTQSVLRTVIHPLEALSIFGRPFEEAARLGEFRKARLAGKTATEAALDAARVTTNFTVHGADAKFWWLAKASAFTNPAIQGADKAFRTILEAPRGETQSAGRIGRAATAVAIRGLVNVSLLSAVLYALNYDDKEIEELRKTKAGSVWWFMRVPGSNVILRFPKPFLWGQMFGTGMEAMIDKARGADPNAMKRWRDEVLEMLTDNVFPIPTPAKMAHELTANKSLFFKRPIVPRGLEGADPEMQVAPRTGETARQIGRAVGYSPAKIEHVVGGIGGTLSREALKLSDSFLRDPGVSPPERHLSELPLVGRAFATGGTTGTYSIERFWREMDEVRTAKTTLREKMKSDPKGARLYAKEKAKQLGAFSAYEATSERLGDLRKSIEAVRKAPDSKFTPAEKTRRIDALEARMNEVAKRTITRGLLEETAR